MPTQQEATWQEFGMFLRRLRTRRGISQEKFARLLGCHRIHIWRLEKGERHPSALFLHNLAQTVPLVAHENEMLTLFRALHEARAGRFENDPVAW